MRPGKAGRETVRCRSSTKSMFRKWSKGEKGKWAKGLGGKLASLAHCEDLHAVIVDFYCFFPRARRISSNCFLSSRVRSSAERGEGLASSRIAAPAGGGAGDLLSSRVVVPESGDGEDG